MQKSTDTTKVSRKKSVHKFSVVAAAILLIHTALILKSEGEGVSPLTLSLTNFLCVLLHYHC